MTASMEQVMNIMANGSTISEAIAITYKSPRVRFAYNTPIFSKPIESLGFTSRVRNPLIRNKVYTLNDAIEFITRHETIKGAGRIILREVFNKIIDVAWNSMTVNERAAFLIDIDNINIPKELITEVA